MSGEQQQGPMSAQTTGGPGSKRDLCLLSLDGGGVRGLSSLLILQKLMESIDPDNPPKPCEYFDMICGTSTGGLIAIMLGRLRLTVDQCIHEYQNLSPLIFTQKHMVPFNSKLKVHGRFNTQGFEKCIQDLVERHTGSKDTLLKEDVQNVPCTASKVFIVTTGLEHAGSVVFSNYYSARRGSSMRNRVTIWEAARATSAAPSFFDPISIDGQKFGDGGTGANNPVSILWGEARDYFKPRRDPSWDLSSNLQCLVSIGTGKLLLKEITDAPNELIEALVAITTDTERKANEFRRNNDSLFRGGNQRAFRFNVVSGLEKVGLSEVDMLPKIKAVTEEYIQSQDAFDDFELCSSHLQQREWFDRLKSLVEVSIAESNSIPIDAKYSQELLETCRHTSIFKSWLDHGPRLDFDMAAIKSLDTISEAPAAALSSAMVSNKQEIDGLQPYFCYSNFTTSESQTSSENPKSVSTQSILRSFILQILVQQEGGNRIDEELVRRLEGKNHGQTLRRLSLSDGNPSPNDLAELFKEIAFAKDACLVIVIEGYDSIPKRILEDLRGVMRMKSPHRLLLSTRSPNNKTAIHERTEYLECCRSLQRNVQANGRRDQIDDPVPGTLDWLWNHEAYTGWNHRKSGILFIQGKPGSGKSVLAKAISNGYENSLVHDPEEDLPLMSSWFYSTRGGPVAQLHESLLQAEILQWLDQDAELWSTIRPFWRESFAAQTFSTFKTLSGVLEKVVSTGRRVMTIVDAIDESNSDPNHDKGAQSGGAVQRKDILEKFQELVSRIPNSRAKFIILSRPICALAELQAKQTTPDYFMITMEQENQDALSLVIEDSLESLKRQILEEKGENGELSLNEKASLERVKSYLTKNSDGVILWPKLIVNDLASALEESDDIVRNLTKRLKSCPRDLTELYKEMVRRVASSKSNTNLEDAQQLLMWISGSAVAFERPITLGALYETSWISTYETNRQNENPFSQDAASDGNLVKFERRLRQLCGTFINVQRKTEFIVHRTDTVELGHRTMKDFLAGPDAGHLRFAQKDSLDLIHKQSERYFNILKECLDRRKDRATSSDPGADLKHSIWEFFGLIERRMFLDLGCPSCETGSSHKDGLHCPREMLGRSIEALETTFESVVEFSTAASLAAISKTFKPEQDKEKSRERDRLLNDLLPVSAFLTREESPTAVNWEKKFNTYLPEKQRELLNTDKSLFLVELIYWACTLGEPATTANLIQPFLWMRFSNNQPIRPTPYRNRFLDLVRTSIVAVVDTGLDRIFYDHLFEYPVLLYTITERMQQVKHNGVEHEESMKRLRKCGRSVLKGYLKENQQHSHDCGTPQDGPNAHGTLLRGQEERTEDDQEKMQRDLRNIYATLNSMASNIRGSRHDGLRNDELKLANICEAISLVLREAETLLIRVTHYQDSSGKLLAPPDISVLRNRHDWKKYIRERSVAGRLGIHHHILGAVDKFSILESDFARFWPKEKPTKLAEDLAREENARDKEREAPKTLGEGSVIDLKKKIPKFPKGWGRK